MRILVWVILIPFLLSSKFSLGQVRAHINFNRSMPSCVNDRFSIDASQSCCDSLNVNVDFGDGTIKTFTKTDPRDLGDISYSYSTPGTYNFKFLIESKGSKDSIEHEIIIYDKPIADFSVSSTTVCLGDSLHFTNLTTGISAPIFYNWKIGRTSSNDEHPKIRAEDSGPLDAFLHTYSDTSICYTQEVKEIFVQEDTSLANFDLTEGCPCNEISFINTSTDTSGSWLWTFSDGSTSTLQNPPTQIFETPGRQFVSLTGTGDNGCVFTRRKIIDVCPDAVEALPHSKSNNRWYFGNRAGIDFSSGMSIALLDAATSSFPNEGRATVSDHKTGDLLFWVGDDKIYNKNQESMPNGSGLLNGYSSSQGPLIVPHPGNVNQYFIFRTFGSTSGEYGLYYCLVDMSLDDGNGDLLIADSILIGPREGGLGNYRNEHLTGVTRSFGQCGQPTSYWVLSSYIQNFTNTVHYYLVDETGLHLNHTQILANHHAGGSGGGMVCFSPDGNRYALTNTYWATDGRIFIYDFDKESGLLYPNPKVQYNTLDHLYGICFSPDNSKLYTSGRTIGSGIGSIRQYDMTSNDVFSTEVSVYHNGIGKHSMYLGPDEKIYVAQYNSDYIGVINFPNLKGLDCDFVEEGVYLGGDGRKSSHGLQNILPRYAELDRDKDTTEKLAIEDVTCDQVTLRIYSHNTNPDSCAYPETYTYRWNFGDGTSDSITFGLGENPSLESIHIFSESGTYNIQLTQSSSLSCYVDTFTQSIHIDDINEQNIALDTNLCSNQQAIIGITRSGVNHQWFPDEGLSCYNCYNPTVLIDQNEQYIISTTTTNGCKYEDTLNIYVSECDIFIPNVFSPNNDLNNDFFYIHGHGIAQYELQIFDKKGTLVFEDIDAHLKWDGTYKGQLLPDDTYTYYALGTLSNGDKFTKSGTIALLR